MPLSQAQRAMGAVFCGSVIEVRTMLGDFSVTEEVAAFITTIGTLPCVATGAAEKAFGVRSKPARMSTLSLTRNSCARRLATAGAMPVSSLTSSLILRPATVSPCSATYRSTPCLICLP